MPKVELRKLCEYVAYLWVKKKHKNNQSFKQNDQNYHTSLIIKRTDQIIKPNYTDA